VKGIALIKCIVQQVENDLIKNNIFLNYSTLAIMVEALLAFYMVSIKKFSLSSFIVVSPLFRSKEWCLCVEYKSVREPVDNLLVPHDFSSSKFSNETIYKTLKNIFKDSAISCDVNVIRALNDAYEKSFIFFNQYINKLDMIKLMLNAKMILMRLGGVSHFNENSIIIHFPFNILEARSCSAPGLTSRF
jgi:hypothetical protein